MTMKWSNIFQVQKIQLDDRTYLVPLCLAIDPGLHRDFAYDPKRRSVRSDRKTRNRLLSNGHWSLARPPGITANRRRKPLANHDGESEEWTMRRKNDWLNNDMQFNVENWICSNGENEWCIQRPIAGLWCNSTTNEKPWTMIVDQSHKVGIFSCDNHQPNDEVRHRSEQPMRIHVTNKWPIVAE